MLVNAVGRRIAITLLAALGGAIAVSACDYEADLADFFGRAPQTTAPGATPSPSAAPTGSPTPSASVSVSPSPWVSASPSLSVTPSPTTQPSPGQGLPTRPPNLPDWQTLRERARIVEYDRLVANPSNFVGEFIYFEGNVQDVQESNGSFRARIRSGGQFLLLLYEADSYWGQPLVQGDRVRVVGDFVGLSNDGLPQIAVLETLIKFT